ncbi:uncharacterized protein LTHEOB_10802 [Neofusicoccum parvum]|nr:uncharacterized protein LTHEOB_10802 [Neofusicoccum parvum]
MQIAEVLSDLTSLRVCDPAAALALVSASAAAATTAPTQTQEQGASADAAEGGGDEDLQRAKDLLALHAVFRKGGSGEGLVEELRGLRERVGRAMGGMGTEVEGVEDGDGEGFEEWD